MITFLQEDLFALHEELGGDLFDLVSRQGMPEGGWALNVSLNGVPLILSDKDPKTLYKQFAEVVGFNDLGEKFPQETIYAHWGLSMLLQCRPVDRRIYLKKFFATVVWPVKDERKKWLSIGTQVLEPFLNSGDFNKPVVSRIWQAWLLCALSPFDAPGQIRASLERRHLDMRACSSPEDAQKKFDSIKVFVSTNWLPSPVKSL